jgi:Family of unknown function (DUF5681)
MDEDDERKPKKGKPKWADKPYTVGKGKPPVKSRFKKGGPSPNKNGRPKGSKNVTSFDKLKAKRVQIGIDDRGRPVWRSLGEVIDHQLLKQAAEGSLAAIKIVKDHEAKLAAQAQRTASDPAEIRRQIEEEQERTVLSEKLRKSIGSCLNMMAQLKKQGIADFVDEQLVIAPWVIEAAQHRVGARSEGDGNT